MMYDFVKQKAAASNDVVSLRLIVHHENTVANNAYLKTGMNELPYLVFQEKLDRTLKSERTRTIN